jgi:hypothetical protein
MSSRAQQREAKLKERCDILADIVESVGPIYRSVTTTEDQKRFIETMIGAAFWYLPVPNECWTKKAYVEAINSHHPNSGDQAPKLTADHEYPRKIAAADLLAKYLSADTNLRGELLHLYLSRYGGFNCITPRENSALMRYQRTEKVIDPLTVYEKAGVKLVSIKEQSYRRLKRGTYTP